MSESRKLQSIDGGDANEDEQVALNHDPEFRSSKASLSKSKEKVSDGAEEKLLSKEEEAKIVTRVDMADAKYHHSNGDTKIELDANKRQFSGLTKEELLKYADDPFWVNLRWFMFVLFWAMWVCMLAGAIAIIVKAPKCAPPTPRTWYEKGPIVDMGSLTPDTIEPELPLLKSSNIQGIFMEAPTYEVFDEPTRVEQFKAFIEKAKEFGIKVIVDLTPNFVSSTHKWFELSINNTGEYADYFVWVPVSKYDENTQPMPPNNWVSTLNESAWTYNNERRAFYLHQYGADQPDLNFHNEKVVQRFTHVINTWIAAGVGGVRLSHGRQLLVDMSFEDEVGAGGRAVDADHTQYQYYTHQRTADRPELDALLHTYAGVVAPSDGEVGVFTVKESGDRPELFTLDRNTSSLRPPSAAPYLVQDAPQAAQHINRKIARGNWPFLQLLAEDGGEKEIALFSSLLPAAPVLALTQLKNDTGALNSDIAHVSSLREDASIEHGHHVVQALKTANDTDDSVLVCARWKSGHTGYLAVYNPLKYQQRVDLSTVTSVPESLTLHTLSRAVKMATNYTSHVSIPSDDVLVPSRGTVVLSYVPKAAAEN